MDKKTIERQLARIDIEILRDLKQQLIEEENKPDSERDEALVRELKETIAENEKSIIEASERRSLENIMNMLDEYEQPKRFKFHKKAVAAVAACLLVFTGMNVVSFKVFGMNLISATYQLTKGGIKITAETPETSEIKTSEIDPFGMKAKCAEHGFFPDTPEYIPDGFMLDHIYEDSNDGMEMAAFFYKNGDSILNFYFTYYKNGTSIPPIGLPTDTYNVTEEVINGKTVYVVKEDKQFNGAFIDHRIQYGIFSENLDYDECKKILENLS